MLAGDGGFNITAQSEIKDLEILEQARRQFDEGRRPDKDKNHSHKGGGKGDAWRHQPEQRKFAPSS